MLECEQEAEEDPGSEVNMNNSLTEEEREEMNSQLIKVPDGSIDPGSGSIFTL